MAISVVSFFVLLMLNRGPGSHSAGFLYCILSPTGLVPKLHRGSQGPLRPGVVAFPTTSCLQLVWSLTLSGAPRVPSTGRWLSLLHLVSDFSSPTSWLPVNTELYNSSIIHSIAHSIFGMACLIVIKRKKLSCSSEVTLFRCISLWVYHGLLPCPISSAKSAYTISFDYWQLECVTSFRCITLERHVWPGRSSIYNINP